MHTEILPAEHPQAILRALALVQSGELVAFPTDTVYGLGASVLDPQAIDRLYVVKGRDTAKAIAVLMGSLDDLPQVAAKMSPMALRLAERFWPGPLTLVVSRQVGLPENLSPLPTIGVRMPDHPVALDLLGQSGPMAVTSANLSGEPSTTTAQQVYAQLAGRIPLIIDGGQTPGGQPSTVVDCTQSELVILRSGPLSLENLQAALARD
jgi:L-threonylcarbamoyladenylate synthase